MTRREGRHPTNTLWIFCEGERTEKNYFRKLKVRMRLTRFRVNVTESTRTDAVSIIEYAENYVKANRGEFQKDDVIYCIFDRDGNDNEKLDKARKMASKTALRSSFQTRVLSTGYYSILNMFNTAAMQKN